MTYWIFPPSFPSFPSYRMQDPSIQKQLAAGWEEQRRSAKKVFLIHPGRAALGGVGCGGGRVVGAEVAVKQESSTHTSTCSSPSSSSSSSASLTTNTAWLSESKDSHAKSKWDEFLFWLMGVFCLSFTLTHTYTHTHTHTHTVFFKVKTVL